MPSGHRRTYFGVKADTDGNFHVRDAATNIEYMAVLACLDQYGNPIVLPIGKCKVSDRDDMTLVSTEVVTFNVTFKMFKPRTATCSTSMSARGREGRTGHQGRLAGRHPEHADRRRRPHRDVQRDRLPGERHGWTITATSGDTAKATATVNGNTVTVTGKSATETGKPVTITATAGGKNVTVPVTVTA